MLLARAVVRRDAPALSARLEAHDSFYVGTEVFDTFFVHNGLWWVRRRQRDAGGFLQGLDGEEGARARILAGRFPAATLRQFQSKPGGSSFQPLIWLRISISVASSIGA